MRRTLQEQVQRQMDLSRELTDEEVEELIMQEILQFSSRDYLLLEEKLEAEIITGYDGVTVEALEEEASVCLVTFAFTVAHGLNQIWLKAQITV